MSASKLRLIRSLACSFALAVLVSATLGQQEPRYHELPNFHQVNEVLYRGAQPKTGGLEKLKALKIKTIINLRDDDERALAEEREAHAAGFDYFNVPFGRLGRPKESDLNKVLAIINSPDKQPVFVHCKYGADRTGVVIGAYRILHDGWTSEQAKAEANRYGMKIWQTGMKDYLHDLHRDQQEKPATRPLN